MANNQRVRDSAGLLKALRATRKRLAESPSLKKGNIVFRLKGEGGGDYCIRCTGKTVRLYRNLPRMKDPPLIEMIGTASAIEQILAKKANPIVQFRRGNFRIRGDIQYIRDLAMVLKLVKKPF